MVKGGKMNREGYTEIFDLPDILQKEASDYFSHNPHAKECAFVLVGYDELNKVDEDRQCFLDVDESDLIVRVLNDDYEEPTKLAVINVNLEYEFPESMSNDDIKTAMQNIELPSQYVSESYEFVKIVKGDK